MRIFACSCSAVSTLSNPCGRSLVIAKQARDTCMFLTDKSKFGKCRNVVHPGPFINSCMLDICSTSLKVSTIKPPFFAVNTLFPGINH